MIKNRNCCPSCNADLIFIADDRDGTRTGLWCRECKEKFDASRSVVREIRTDGEGAEWELADDGWRRRG